MTAVLSPRSATVGTRAPARLAVVAAVLVVVALIGSQVFGGSSEDRSDALAGVDGPGFDSPVEHYRIVYEVTFAGTDAFDEELAVARPFASRVTSGTTARIADVGVFATTSDGDEWLRIASPIAPAIGDLRPSAALDQALADGLVRAAGAREVGGRSCDLYDLGGPVTSGFIPLGAVEGESARVCIDELGLVLWESWSIGDEVIRTREAIELSFDEVDDALFEVPASAQSLPFEKGGGAVRPVDPDANPGFVEYWRLDEVPDGFDLIDRWAVVPPVLDAEVDELVGRSADVAVITDAWRRGPDLLLLDQGASTRGAGPPWDLDEAAKDVDLGPLGRGRMIVSLRMTEIRLLRPEGGFVRVAGTLPPDQLLDITRSLDVEGLPA